MRRLVIIGASGHGKVCADVAKLCGYGEIVFLDDDTKRDFCAGYKVVGTRNDYRSYVEAADFFVAVGRSEIRRGIMEEVEAGGGKLATLIHPDAVISSDVEIGKGTVIMAGVVINADTLIGRGVIVNTSSSVDHDCIISDYCHISVGAHLSGTVKVGVHTWVGAGAVISNNVDICGNCVIGAGGVVIKDIVENGTYVGVPVMKLKKTDYECGQYDLLI